MILWKKIRTRRNKPKINKAAVEEDAIVTVAGRAAVKAKTPKTPKT